MTDGWIELGRKPPASVLIGGVEVRRGSRVRLHPSGGGDAMDVALAGRTAVVDAVEQDIEEWYVARFLTLRETVFRNEASYFHRYAHLTEDEAIKTGRDIWRRINWVNLRENILPTRERAHLILKKGAEHQVEQVKLRKI
jgi:type I pantothenate kinase